jgi:hypothetical protein
MVSYYFYHERNLFTKSRNNRSNKYQRIFEEFIQFREQFYEPYKNQQIAITGISEENIDEKVLLLDRYLRDVDQFIDRIKREFGIKITSQSKFRPTILEEFCGFLFKDIPEIASLNLDLFQQENFRRDIIG